jgi:hypothetical protein
MAGPFAFGQSQDCLMCPFGLFFFTMRNLRPETMEHLAKAAHELTLAVKAMVDQVADRWDQGSTLERIPVD